MHHSEKNGKQSYLGFSRYILGLRWLPAWTYHWLGALHSWTFSMSVWDKIIFGGGRKEKLAAPEGPPGSYIILTYKSL